MSKPRNKPSIVLPACMALAAIGTAPFAFSSSAPSYWLGIPAWLWSSFGCTALLSFLTAFWMLRYWPEDDDE